MDVIQHLLGGRIGLGQTLHVIDELTTVHRVSEAVLSGNVGLM
jgi:hypothetical protein